MGRMASDKSKVTVSFSPQELLLRPCLSPDGSLSGIADSIEDVIRRAAWHAINQYHPEYLNGKMFDYGMVEVQDGQFVITFVAGKPMKPEPGRP